jgi:hypothetical protein
VPEFVRQVIDLVQMRPVTAGAVAVALFFYIRFMMRGPHTR